MNPGQIGAQTAQICGEDARHIRNVLRMGVGAPLIVCDGSGDAFTALITTVGPDSIGVRLLERSSHSVESPLELTVAQGLLKDKKMDVLLRHLTELGITGWAPFQADRSVPRTDEKKRRIRCERWEKIAREALKQCGRSRLPKIGVLDDFSAVLAAAEDFALKLFFWENARESLPDVPLDSKTRPSSVFMVLGPEGGFTADEAALARQAGFAIVSLGPRILRAETAALAACALVQYRYGDMAADRPKMP